MDLSLGGQTKERDDVQFGYAFEREEQDAIISSFAESKQRAPTNIVQHRIYGLWKIRANTTAALTLWIGRTLNSNLEHALVAPGTVTGTDEIGRAIACVDGAVDALERRRNNEEHTMVAKAFPRVRRSERRLKP